MNHKEKMIEVFETAKGYIERGWTTWAMARDSKGHVVSHRDPKAVCWCLLGAIRAVENSSLYWDSILSILNRYMVSQYKNSSHILWNDIPGRTKEHVLNLLDLCIYDLRGDFEC